MRYRYILPMILSLTACQGQSRPMTPEEQRYEERIYREVQSYCQGYARTRKWKYADSLIVQGHAPADLVYERDVVYELDQVESTAYKGCMLDRGLRP